MTKPSLHDLIADIHQANAQFVLAVTGGGSSAISELLSVPGASNTIIESLVPYGDAALKDFLNVSPASSCSAETARAMATQAFQRAKKLQSSGDVVGLGLTAALTTHRQRRGSDRCHIAIQTSRFTLVALLTLDKQLSRADQEAECRELTIKLMAYSCGLVSLPEQAELEIIQANAPNDWQALMAGDIKATTTDQPVKVLFPGAFNPPHEGHGKIKQLAEELTGLPVTFEISTSNVDKPPLDFIEMLQRQTWLKGQSLVFTHAPTFLQKSALFANVVFLVGIDTITRIAEKKYYDDSSENRDIAIQFLIDNGHRFLVFGRLVDGDYLTLADVELPQNFREICDEIGEAQFRQDVSSSELRSKPKSHNET